MTITRAQLETELVSRTKGYLEAVSMAVTFAGANADLNSPLGYAIRQCGGTVSNPSSVADGDVATLASPDFDKLADLAEERLLMNIKRRWGKVDFSIGPRSESLSQLAGQLDKDIEAVHARNADQYGISGGTITAGVLDLAFMQTDE